MSEIQIAAREGRVARRRALVRQRILEAAEQLMTERGVDDVTIDDITDAADIARGVEFMNETASFPHSPNDDQVDAMTQYLERSGNSGMSFLSGLRRANQ